jgi:hypothetical protein
MSQTLTKEEVMEWRRSTEKITLEEYAKRLGKSIEERKETNDLHDLLLKRQDSPDDILELNDEIQKPDFEIKISFKKKLNKREEIVFNYFCKKKNQKVMINDLAKILDLPNDYVYKYIKNLRSKLNQQDMLENAEKGGYILNL